MEPRTAHFGSAEGFDPLFGSHGSYVFNDPAQLGWFALIGILGGLIGLLYELVLQRAQLAGVALLLRAPPSAGEQQHKRIASGQLG